MRENSLCASNPYPTRVSARRGLCCNNDSSAHGALNTHVPNVIHPYLAPLYNHICIGHIINEQSPSKALIPKPIFLIPISTLLASRLKAKTQVKIVQDGQRPIKR